MTAVPQVRRDSGERARGHLRVVRPAPRRHTLLFATLLGLFAAATIFATVAVSALGAADSVTVRELQREVADAERRYSALVAEVAALEDPARIERIATEEFDMVRPADARYVVLDRALPGDGEGVGDSLAGIRTDPLKPVLSVER